MEQSYFNQVQIYTVFLNLNIHGCSRYQSHHLKCTIFPEIPDYYLGHGYFHWDGIYLVRDAGVHAQGHIVLVSWLKVISASSPGYRPASRRK